MPPVASEVTRSTAAEHALAAMRAAVFGSDPMAPPAPTEPSIQAPSDPQAPVNASPSANPTELNDFLEAAGLLEYDPAAITRIYAGHPQRLARRLRQTLIPISLYLVGVGVDRFLGRLKEPERARARARECAELLAQLGPAFIKAGQVLASRPDIMRADYMEELRTLQVHPPPYHSKPAMFGTRCFLLG
jgi:hypothetical protein